jgi:hypothetical protein
MHAAMKFVRLSLRQLDQALEFASPLFQLAIRLYVTRPRRSPPFRWRTRFNRIVQYPNYPT